MRAAAQLSVRGRADWPAAAVALCASLLQCKQLLGTEGLVVDLGRRFDQVLEVCSQEEVPQVDKFAVVLVFNVDDTPSVLATSDLVTVYDDGLLGSHNGEGNQVLWMHVSLLTRHL